MPVPTPHANEEQGAFISRCMEAMKDEFPDQQQRLAVCFNTWRARSGEPTVFKTFVADEVKAGEGDARTVRFTISTGTVDRERDTLAPGGWKLDNFLKNPTILWAHDYRQLPIARAKEIAVTERGLSSLAEFPPKGVHPFADTVYDLLKGGFLNATSVGFRPIKSVYNEERRGTDYMEHELLEFSVVPVPANPEALVEARAVGIDLEPIKVWARGLLATELLRQVTKDSVPAELLARFDKIEAMLHAGVTKDETKDDEPLRSIVLEIEDVQTVEDFLELAETAGFDVDRDLLQTAIRESIQEGLNGVIVPMVAEKMRLAMMRLTGRVD